MWGNWKLPTLQMGVWMDKATLRKFGSISKRVKPAHFMTPEYVLNRNASVFVTKQCWSWRYLWEPNIHGHLTYYQSINGPLQTHLEKKKPDTKEDTLYNSVSTTLKHWPNWAIRREAIRVITLGKIARVGSTWGVPWVLLNVLLPDRVDGDGAVFILCRFTKLSVNISFFLFLLFCMYVILQ